MRKRKFVSALIICILLITSLTIALVACKPKDDDTTEPPKEFTVNDATKEIAEAFRTTYLYNGLPFGWDINLNAMDYTVTTQGRLDSSTAENNKIDFKLVKGANQVIRLSADKEYLYLVAGDVSKRLKDFQLAQVVKNNADLAPTTDTNEEIVGYMELALSALFTEGKVKKVTNEVFATSTYTLEGSLDAVLETLNKVLAEQGVDLSTVTNELKGTTIKLEANVDANKILKTFDISLGGNSLLSADKFEMSNECKPQVDLPAGRESFATTHALNFTLEGTVDLKDKVGIGKVNTVYSMGYEIRVDFNIFRVLRECIKLDDNGSLTFDPVNIFSDPTNSIFVDLSHKCGLNENACEFCQTYRENGSNGSLLTLAYAPADFGSNKAFIALDPLAVLPKGLVSGLTGGMNGLLTQLTPGEYIGIALDPTALLINNDNYKNAPKTSVATVADTTSFDISSLFEKNILGMIFDVADFLSGITVSATNGFELDTNKLNNVLEMASPDVAALLSQFFTGVDFLNVKVNNAIYGDAKTLDMDMYREYMVIDEALGVYKSFNHDLAVTTPVKNVEWKKDKDGNIMINSKAAAPIVNYDAEGNALNLSPAEAKALFANASVNYTATLVDGTTKEYETYIKAVYGLDYTKVGEEQTVTVVTQMTDGGELSSLLSQVGELLGVDLNFSGDYFTTKIKLTDIEGDIEFYQPDGTTNAYDPNKTYKYNDLIEKNFTAKLTYTDGKTKEAIVQPRNIRGAMDSTGKKLQVLGDYDIVYDVFGTEKIVHIDVEDGYYYDHTNKISLAPGQEYTTNNYEYVYYMDGDVEKNVKVTFYNSDKTNLFTTATVVEGDASAMSFNATCQLSEKGVFSFSKPGVYTVEMYRGRGFTQTYVFTVTEPIVLPGYAFTSTILGNETTVDIVRTNQSGSGIDANVVVVNGSVTLERGVDYNVYELDADGNRVLVENSFYLNSFLISGKRIIIVANDGVTINDKTTIKLVAPQVDNAEIASGTPVNALSKYSFTADAVASASGGQVYIPFAAIVADADKIADAEFAVEIKIKVDGATDWTTLTASDFAYGYLYPLGGKIYYYNSSSYQFGFSEDGLISDKPAAICLKGVKSTNVVYEITVTCTNYDNFVIATVTNA